MQRLALLFCLSSGLACSSQPQESAVAKGAKDAPEVAAEKPVFTIYSGRSAILVEPLLKEWAAAEGVEVKLRFNKNTEALANRLVTEGDRSDADLFFAQAVGYLTTLGDRGHLRPLPEALLAQVPETARGPKKHWVATSGRLRVLVYSPERVKAEELPKRLEDLVLPQYKGRIGWAPGNASMQAHVSALRSLWGVEKTKTWLTAMKAQNPARYPKNSPQVKAVDLGEIDMGWVNHYYLHKIKAANPGLKAANHSFQGGDAGNVMMLAGVGIPKSSEQVEYAEKLIAFLLSPKGQSYFTQKAYEYPVVEGVALHPDVKLPEGLAQNTQAALNDVAASLTLLRELGID